MHDYYLSEVTKFPRIARSYLCPFLLELEQNIIKSMVLKKFADMDATNPLLQDMTPEQISTKIAAIVTRHSDFMNRRLTEQMNTNGAIVR